MEDQECNISVEEQLAIKEMDAYFFEAKELVDTLLNSALMKLFDMTEVETMDLMKTENQLCSASWLYKIPMEPIINIDWPTIEDFNVDVGEVKIEEFVKTWEVECSWLYCIDYLGVDDHQFDVRHRYRVRWSVPTRRKPIPRSTASVYFTCSVSKVKPKTHKIDVLFVLEGNRLVHIPGKSRFRKKWLGDLISNKAAMMKMVDF